jgi:hypothetical protein
MDINKKVLKAIFDQQLAINPTLTAIGEGTIPYDEYQTRQDKFWEERRKLENEFENFVKCTEIFFKLPQEDIQSMRGANCFSVAETIRDDFKVDFSDGVLILVLRSLNVKLEKIEERYPLYQINKDQPENSFLHRG